MRTFVVANRLRILNGLYFYDRTKFIESLKNICGALSGSNNGQRTLVTDANGQYRRSERLGRIIVEEKINRRRRKERHSRQQREGNIHDAFNNNS